MTATARERGILSGTDVRSRGGRTVTVVNLILLAGLVVTCLGPLLVMVKMAVTPTQETLQNPFSWFTSGQVQWGNFVDAWNRLDLGHYLLNTVIQTVGAAAVVLIVASTGAYALSVLRPWWGGVVTALVMATLLIPNVVTLVPLYLTVLDLPLVHVNLLNTHWAIWLPAGASAFSVLIVKRFFDSIPREYLEAAKMDGAGPLRTFLVIVIPLARPILGVVVLLTFMNAWKDYLWPLLVVKDPAVRPLSVQIPEVTSTAEFNVTMATMLLAIIGPILLFVIFQREILRGISMGSGVKG